jgi:hypothetical protein
MMENAEIAFALPVTEKTRSRSGAADRSSATAVTESDYDGPYKIYSKWTEPFPCFPAEKSWKAVKTQRSPAHEGLLYTREMKTGSSTLAGVILRLANRKSKELLPDSHVPCKLRMDHSSATSMDYANRDKKKSFLMSLLRDPTKRAISHVCHFLCTSVYSNFSRLALTIFFQFFHFRVSDEGLQPIDQVFQQWVYDRKNVYSNYYVKDLTTKPIHGLKDMEDYSELVQTIIDEFDFIGITERMDESLVVLKMLLDLKLGDILYMSAKTQGSFTSAGGGDGPRCIYIIPSFLTPGMKEFFQSDYWKRYIAADVALYEAAQASLDKTIEKLGRQEFEENLSAFQIAKEKAQIGCEDRTIYRCNPAGEYVAKNSTCLMWDVGCGYECLDEFGLQFRKEL